MSSCAFKASFPADQLESSLAQICKKDYSLDVTARLTGHTLGAMCVMDNILNEQGDGVVEDFRKKIGDLIYAVQRVALSTDADIRFVAAVVRGKKDLVEIQVVRYNVDIKKIESYALSADESMNRTLWKQSKLKGDPEDFDTFYLKDWNLEDFLAQQVVQRLRMAITPSQNPNSGTAILPPDLVDGRFRSAADERTFIFSMVSFEDKPAELNAIKVLRVVSDVFGGYRYEDYDKIVIKDLLNKKTLVLDRDTLDQFLKKRISEDDILRKDFKDDLSDTDRLRNAIEVLKFNFQ